jgi:hypothetical protein
VLAVVLRKGHYDKAAAQGFDQSAIFAFIRRECVALATMTLTDQNFVRFTKWLADRDDRETIKAGKTALVEQGRTKEVKRMQEGIARWMA